MTDDARPTFPVFHLMIGRRRVFETRDPAVISARARQRYEQGDKPTVMIVQPGLARQMRFQEFVIYLATETDFLIDTPTKNPGADQPEQIALF